MAQIAEPSVDLWLYHMRLSSIVFLRTGKNLNTMFYCLTKRGGQRKTFHTGPVVWVSYFGLYNKIFSVGSHCLFNMLRILHFLPNLTHFSRFIPILTKICSVLPLFPSIFQFLCLGLPVRIPNFRCFHSLGCLKQPNDRTVSKPMSTHYG